LPLTGLADDPDRVPNRVPDYADLTWPYPTQLDEASLDRTESERQRANHNPRVGGSSPSSGITNAPHMRWSTAPATRPLGTDEVQEVDGDIQVRA
jgi:hypothetical protein